MKSAAEALGFSSVHYELASGGRNKGALVVGDGTRSFVLKFFETRSGEDYSRFVRELSFLRWGKTVSLENIPSLLNYSCTGRWIAIEELRGRKLAFVRDWHMANAGNFVVQLAEKSSGFIHKRIRAREALDSPKRLLSQLKLKRVETQRALAKREDFSSLSGMLEGISEGYGSQQIRRDVTELAMLLKQLSDLWRTTVIYSPSDFGLHNCLEDDSKVNLSLSFFDFEYSGSDHPLKLVMDFLLQPDYLLAERHQTLFLEELKRIFPLDLGDIPHGVWRLFVLKWALIIAKSAAREVFQGRASLEASQDKLSGYLSRFGGYFG